MTCRVDSVRPGGLGGYPRMADSLDVVDIADIMDKMDLAGLVAL